MATSRLPAPPAIEPAAGAQRGSGGNGGLAAPPTMRHCQRNRVKRLRDKEGCRSEHISQSKLTRRFSEMHRAGILPAGTNCRRNADQDRTLYSRCRAEVLYVRPDNGPQAAEYLWEDEVIRDPVSTKTAIETAKTANGSRPIENARRQTCQQPWPSHQSISGEELQQDRDGDRTGPATEHSHIVAD
jgi:hypothetical protein